MMCLLLQSLFHECTLAAQQTQEAVDAGGESQPGRSPSLKEAQFGGTLSAVQLLADAERETSPWLYYALSTAEKRSLLTVVRMLGVMCVEHNSTGSSSCSGDANATSSSDVNSSSSEALLIMGLEAEALREVVARRYVLDCLDVSQAVDTLDVHCISV
jgi:hypothetical protein